VRRLQAINNAWDEEREAASSPREFRETKSQVWDALSRLRERSRGDYLKNRDRLSLVLINIPAKGRIKVLSIICNETVSNFKFEISPLHLSSPRTAFRLGV